MIFNHLVCFGSLMDVSQVARHLFNAACEWENRLFKLFKAAIGQPKVVEDICFVSQVRLILKGLFHHSDALLVSLK